ncbi:hypothetical protein Nmel_005575 [Mimus melanotis]
MDLVAPAMRTGSVPATPGVGSDQRAGSGQAVTPPSALLQRGARGTTTQAGPQSVKEEEGRPWKQWTPPPPPSLAPAREVGKEGGDNQCVQPSAGPQEESPGGRAFYREGGKGTSHRGSGSSSVLRPVRYHGHLEGQGAASEGDIIKDRKHTAWEQRCNRSCIMLSRIGTSRGRLFATTESDSSHSNGSEEEEEDEEMDEIIAALNRRRRGRIARKVLRELSNQGSIYVKVPYSLIELEQWKTTIGKYKKNPNKVAKLVEQAINSQNPDWADLNSILDTLLDPTVRQMVNKAISTSVEGSIASGLLQGTVSQIFPLENSGWDPNIPEHMVRLKRY